LGVDISVDEMESLVRKGDYLQEYVEHTNCSLSQYQLDALKGCFME